MSRFATERKKALLSRARRGWSACTGDLRFAFVIKTFACAQQNLGKAVNLWRLSG